MASISRVVERPAPITSVPTIEAARLLPKGSVVGDLCGGVTFTDAVAAVLESRSPLGWQEVRFGEQDWTVIVLDR
jgi:hypothetical protein